VIDRYVRNKEILIHFLTLPERKKAVAIFGKGFQLNLLKDARWLAEKQILCWGDIDCHGFQILSQLLFSTDPFAYDEPRNV